MNGFPRRRRYFIAAVICGTAAACSDRADPASETPVDPAPGLYEITLSGAGLLKHAGPEDAAQTYCLRESASASFPHLLAENYYKLHYSCTTRRGAREGNAVAGEISCPADPKLASGANRFVYRGAVGREKTRVEVRMKLDAQLKEGAGGAEVSDAQMKLAMKALEQARFVIEARRTGACG